MAWQKAFRSHRAYRRQHLFSHVPVLIRMLALFSPPWAAETAGLCRLHVARSGKNLLSEIFRFLLRGQIGWWLGEARSPTIVDVIPSQGNADVDYTAEE